MTPKEKPYEDREITTRGNETVKLSELTKDERDIYWAGFSKGADTALDIVLVFLVIVIFIVVGLIVNS